MDDLKQQKIYSLTVLQVRILESKSQQGLGHAPSEATRGEPYLASSSIR